VTLYTFERSYVVVNEPRRIEWSSLRNWMSWEEPYVVIIELDDAVEAALNGSEREF
jgi:hypothetical protein